MPAHLLHLKSGLTTIETYIKKSSHHDNHVHASSASPIGSNGHRDDDADDDDDELT